MPADRLMASRPDILDRNGEVLATDIRTVSLYAEPHKMSMPRGRGDAGDVLPDIDIKAPIANSRRSRISSGCGGSSRQSSSQILALGIPASGSGPRSAVSIRRRDAAHIVGYVNIDNRGVAGMEKYIDTQGTPISRRSA